MTVKSADKKPEKYVGPDGKPKIRMVSVDKEVVKSEAYDEPQGQAKRIMSPLQKARMDKEKADRDRDGKLKSESKNFKDFREANTPVGQRDKMKIIDRKPHPDGGHIVTMQTKAGKTIKRHLKNGKVKDMKEAVSKLPGGNKHLATAGTKATIMHPITRVSKKVDKKDLKKHVDAGWKHMGQKRNRVEDTDEGYASDAQRKAVWASKNEKSKKESVELDEVATSAMKKAGTELNAYAKKSGGIDKADFMKAADMLSTGKAGMEFIKFVNGQDTEVFEKIISVMSKHMGRQTVEKMFKVRVREGAMKRIATTQSNKAERIGASGSKGLDTFKKKSSEVSEISNKTLTRYAMSADNDVQKRRSNRPAGKGDESDPKIGKRLDKINLAHKKGAFKVAESFDHTDHEDNAFAHGQAYEHHKEHGHHDLAAHHLKASDHHEKALKHYSDGNKQKGGEHARKAMSHASKAYEASLDKRGEHHKISHDAFVSSMKTMSKTPVTRKESVELDEISKKTAQSYLDKTKGDDAWSGTRKANNRLKGAIHAVGKLRKKESVDEVLDTPKAMQSYKDKAKYSRDRASGSAAAKILSKGTLGSHKPELDTMRKRHKGMDMADRNAKKKTFDALRGKK